MDIHELQQQKTIRLRVTPKASRNALKVEHDEHGIRLRVYVTAVPENGKANKQVIKLVSKALGVGITKLEILQGATGKDKILKVLD